MTKINWNSMFPTIIILAIIVVTPFTLSIWIIAKSNARMRAQDQAMIDFREDLKAMRQRRTEQ